MPKTILDTTLLSNFSHIQRPDLLQVALGQDVSTTAAVIAELKSGVTAGWVPRCDWSWLPVTTPTEDEQHLAEQYSLVLDPGEAACLAIASRRAWVFASDDLAARRLAQHEGVSVSGTLGVLLKLIATCVLTLDEANGFLAIMVSRGYRAPVKSLRDL